MAFRSNAQRKAAFANMNSQVQPLGKMNTSGHTYRFRDLDNGKVIDVKAGNADESIQKLNELTGKETNYTFLGTEQDFKNHDRMTLINRPNAVQMLSKSKKAYKDVLEDSRFSQIEGHFARGETQKYNEKYLRLGNDKYEFIKQTNEAFTNLNRDVRMLPAEDKKALYNFLKEEDEPQYGDIVRYDTEYINDVITLGLVKRLFKVKY